MKDEHLKYGGALAFIVILAVGGVAFNGSQSTQPAKPGSSTSSGVCDMKTAELNNNVDNWKDYKLVDINSCETFKISELEKPVLVETFAVWCPTCTRQQQEVKKYHEQTGITSVSLDTDVNEDAKKVKSHTEKQGFDWKYAISPPGMTRSLMQEHGRVMANPPSAPMVLLCENGDSRRLPTGVKPVSKLQEEVEKGC